MVAVSEVQYQAVLLAWRKHGWPAFAMVCGKRRAVAVIAASNMQVNA
jgi:hypothetical protein